MKISGFTICRNAISLDYPFLESIASTLPLVDELVVALGASTDSTREALLALQQPKLKIVDTVWDDSLRTGGQVLAIETNKALAAIDPAADWAIYIQADEVWADTAQEHLLAAMQQHLHRPQVEALLVNYLHFFGSYGWVADGTNWYRREIRVLRNTGQATSWGDAQGFRHHSGRKLRAAACPATMHHYGWVRHPAAQQRKQQQVHRLWHSDQWIAENVEMKEMYQYSRTELLRPFSGQHPQAMAARIAQHNWDFQPSTPVIKPKERFKRFCRKYFKFIPGEYQNYKLV